MAACDGGLPDAACSFEHTNTHRRRFCFQADQVFGPGSSHKDARDKVCDQIVANREFYTAFVEDEEGFDKYVKRMRKDGQVSLASA